MNVHLSYKNTSYCRMLFWCGGLPRQLSRLKEIRALTDPGGVYRKGIIIQGGEAALRFTVIVQS